LTECDAGSGTNPWVIRRHRRARLSVQQLTSKAGFLPEQARSFLPQLVAKVVDLVKGGTLDIKSLLGGGDPSSIIGKLGLGQIASKIGIDEAKATTGAKAVLPGIAGALAKGAGGLGGLGGLAAGAGDLLKKATSLFEKQN
jgi:hypothetical protein